MEVFQPVHKGNSSSEERSKAISSLMFLKERQDKSIKGRMCAEGRKQQETWTKQESASPTMATESVFITAVIAAHKGQDVRCFDILGAVLHANLDEDITMILKGPLAELMLQAAPNLYRKYITIDRKNTPILYAKMQKALDGLIRSALLFYQKLVSNLESNGFVLSPYYSCVTNKVIHGKQMTICWHIDNLNVLHEDPQKVTAFGKFLNKMYRISVLLHRGNVHNHLRMIFDYSHKGKVMVNTTEYIKNMISDFPEEIIGTKTSPASDHLFEVRDPTLSKLLPEE
jgi:hypothetical protein